MAAVTICSDFGAKKFKSLTVSIVSPSICHEVMWPDAMILVFWMLSFKATFSLYSFTFIKRLFSCSSLSAIKVVSSAYLRLLIFLPAILIPVCASSSLAFCMMYSAFKLNKQGDNKQPWYTPFLIWNKSVVPCTFLTVAFWPAYRFLRRQVTCSGIPISLRIFHSFLWIILLGIYPEKNTPVQKNARTPVFIVALLTMVKTQEATPWTAACQVSLSTGVFQARILDWVAISFSRGYSQLRDWTHVSYVSCIGRQVLYH